MEYKTNKRYITTTDKFMSGWGHAKNKINKLVFECKDLNQALIVFDNAINRSDQKNVNILTYKPYYKKDRYYTQYKTIENYPKWYIKNAF